LFEPCLIDEAGKKEPYLHEHEVGGGVEVGEAVEGEVVVEAVEGGGDQVEDQDPPILPNSLNQGCKTESKNMDTYDTA
jgi:hypothetical protein